MMYDVAIIGGGPAGLAAAVYAARYMLKTVVLTSTTGGQIIESHKVENFPGQEPVTGLEMMNAWKKQAIGFGAEIKEGFEVKGVRKKGKCFLINNEVEAKSVILAPGMQRRKLDVDGEQEFSGKGVSYCATCDAAFFRDKRVGVVGGSDSAARAAQLLTEYAAEVIIIYRKDAMRAEPVLVKELEDNPKVSFEYKANVKKIVGDGMMTGVELDTGKKLDLGGLFIEIGAVPSSAMASELGVKLDKEFIKVKEDMSTSVPGVFAAGDVTTGSNRFNQVLTAAAEGSIAAEAAYKFLK